MNPDPFIEATRPKGMLGVMAIQNGEVLCESYTEDKVVEGAESPFPSAAPQHIVLVTDWLHDMLWPNPGKWTFDI